MLDTLHAWVPLNYCSKHTYFCCNSFSNDYPFPQFQVELYKALHWFIGYGSQQPNNIHMRLLQPSYNGHLPHILWTSPLWTLPIKSRNKSFTWVLMVDHFAHTTPTPNIFNKFNNPKLLLNNLLFVLTIVSIHF